MNEPTHRELRELLGWYAAGRADDAERVRIEAHLDGCADCRAELDGLRRVLTALAPIDPDRIDDVPTPPADLGDTVLARIVAERSAELAPRRTVSARWLTAACVVAIALGVGVGWLVKPAPAGPPLEAVAVQADQTDLQASANLIAHTWGVEIQLMATGFDAGETYQVELVSRTGAHTSAGEFIGTGDVTMRCNLNSSVLRPDAAGFEVVDEDGAVVLASSF